MKVKPLGIFILVISLTLCGLPVLNCRWEAVAESAPEPKGGDDLRAKAQNPVSSMYSLPLKLTADFGAGNGTHSMFFKTKGFDVYAVDSDPIAVRRWDLVLGAKVAEPDPVEGHPALHGRHLDRVEGGAKARALEQTEQELRSLAAREQLDHQLEELAAPLPADLGVLRAVERLDLAFLVNAQHHRLVRRVHVEPDDVDDLLLELRIVRDLEGPDEMRLETGLPPDALNRRV